VGREIILVDSDSVLTVDSLLDLLCVDGGGHSVIESTVNSHVVSLLLLFLHGSVIGSFGEAQIVVRHSDIVVAAPAPAAPLVRRGVAGLALVDQHVGGGGAVATAHAPRHHSRVVVSLVMTTVVRSEALLHVCFIFPITAIYGQLKLVL